MASTERIWIAAALMIAFAGAVAAQPVLYDEPQYQSPVRAEPDDLLMLAGSGLANGDYVVYKRTSDGQALIHPSSLPGSNNADEGKALNVSYANVPDSLSFVLPPQIMSGYAYGLWIYRAPNQWSGGVRINDARPMWITPSIAYASAKVAELPRELKVVGRNLQKQPGSSTIVKLVRQGNPPTTYTLTAVDDGNPATPIEHYIAKVTLPSSMTSGTYNVSVARDGTSFVPLTGQALSVSVNPPTGLNFSVSSYGCSGADSNDDTGCILSAINQASSAGGGNVTFGAGTWYLKTSTPPVPPYPTCDDASGTADDDDPWHPLQLLNGIVVPVNVNLIGAGASQTTIKREGVSNDCKWRYPAFTVLGKNTIKGIKFVDTRPHEGSLQNIELPSFFQLGKAANDPSPGPNPVADVTFTQNVFDRPLIAIGAVRAVNIAPFTWRRGSFPVRRLFVTYNEFGAYFTALFPDGKDNAETPTALKYIVEDSVVAFNTFKPGAYYSTFGQGTMASALGAGRRVDFSNNIADGTSATYITPAPQGQSLVLPGWRAGFFWHMRGAQERILVSNNTIRCAGDKPGDGEAIVFDGNPNVSGFDTTKVVASADATSVTVAGTLIKPGSTGYYDDHFVHIVSGLGIGQVRAIDSYSFPGGQVKFNVSPAWDVIPDSSSHISVVRTYWQVYTVQNYMDELAPGCAHNKHTDLGYDPATNVVTQNGPVGFDPEGGEIHYHGNAADSAIEGNTQYGTDGIWLRSNYNDTAVPVDHDFKYFIEVRGNLIDDEYAYDDKCSHSGIEIRYGTGPNEDQTPVLHYGVSIGRNTVDHADGSRGGGVSLVLGTNPPTDTSPLAQNVLVHHNNISDVLNPNASEGSCLSGNRVGVLIDVSSQFPNWAGNTTLYGNTFCRIGDDQSPHSEWISDFGYGTVQMDSPTCTPGCICQ